MSKQLQPHQLHASLRKRYALLYELNRLRSQTTEQESLLGEICRDTEQIFKATGARSGVAAQVKIDCRLGRGGDPTRSITMSTQLGDHSGGTVHLRYHEALQIAAYLFVHAFSVDAMGADEMLDRLNFVASEAKATQQKVGQP